MLKLALVVGPRRDAHLTQLRNVRTSPMSQLSPVVGAAWPAPWLLPESGLSQGQRRVRNGRNKSHRLLGRRDDAKLGRHRRGGVYCVLSVDVDKSTMGRGAPLMIRTKNSERLAASWDNSAAGKGLYLTHLRHSGSPLLRCSSRATLRRSIDSHLEGERAVPM